MDMNEMAREPRPPEDAALSRASPLRVSPMLDFTTHGLAPAEQFGFWQECNGGLVEVSRMPGEEGLGFEASGSLWRLGSFVLSTGSSEACRYTRTAAQIRRDSIDHWVVSVIRQGQRRFRDGNHVLLNEPSAAIITSFDQPYETVRDASKWLQLYLPRDSFPELGPALDAARYRRLEAPMERMLQDYVLLLAGRLPGMAPEEAARMGEATRAMVAACIQPDPDRLMQAGPQVELVQMAQIKRLIRNNLGSAMLGPDRLCRQGGVSRSKLYRMFEPYGGVARFIQAERLKRAHAALSDAGDTRSVGRIAEDVGLFDLSSFGRMFRASFGCSPRELRLAVAGGGMAGGPAHVAAGGRAPGRLTEVLRAL